MKTNHRFVILSTFVSLSVNSAKDAGVRSFAALLLRMTHLLVIFFFVSHSAFAAKWDQGRDLDVDKELAGMSLASTILPPDKHENGNANPKQGMISGQSPSDASAAPKAGSSGSQPNVDADLDAGTGGTDENTSGGGGGGNLLDANLSGSTDEGISADAGTTVTEETPTVGVDVGGGEDYLISADATVGDTTVSADLIPVSETTDIGAEVDASGDLSGSEADIGVEADVDGSVSGDDIASDPADGLAVL